VPLSGREIDQLAEAVDRQWDEVTLSGVLLDELDLVLGNLTSAGTLQQKVRDLVVALNARRPPRDRELLEALVRRGNTALRAVATALLTPPFYSPTNDPVDAILLGRAAFVDRKGLRKVVREFANPTVNSTRVLVVRGKTPGGKSYTWEFLGHLARVTGVVPHRLRLRNANFAPRQLVEQAFRLLTMDLTALPPAADDPQDATQIRALVPAFMGQVPELTRPFWLVIDDLNDRGVTDLLRETAYALAAAVEDAKPENLSIALLGYNGQFADGELRLAAQEDALFPDARGLAAHFELMAAAGPNPLPAELALDYATVLLSKYPQLTKVDMIELTPQVEKMGELLRQGERP
jgi:hypothetical protein